MLDRHTFVSVLISAFGVRMQAAQRLFLAWAKEVTAAQERVWERRTQATEWMLFKLGRRRLRTRAGHAKQVAATPSSDNDNADNELEQSHTGPQAAAPSNMSRATVLRTARQDFQASHSIPARPRLPRLRIDIREFLGALRCVRERSSGRALFPEAVGAQVLEGMCVAWPIVFVT